MTDVELLPCAERGLALGESIAGTAPEEAGVLAIEQPGPWGADVPADSRLEPLAAELEAHAAAAGLKVLLIRRQTRRYDVQEGRTVLVARFEPRTLKRLVVTDPREILDLDLTTPGAGEPVTDPVLLACTHSTRDACCARLGLPLARALMDTGTETWHCSHLGGHRFAPTMAVLPHGLWLGRVHAPEAAAVVGAVRGDQIPLAHLRGRAGLPKHVQVADAALREQEGLLGLDDVVAEDLGDGRARLTTSGGERWLATVRTEPTGVVRAVSCGPDAKRQDPGRTVTTLARDDAGPGPRLKA